jgi:oligopeptide transport system substrate-binding protein
MRWRSGIAVAAMVTVVAALGPAVARAQAPAGGKPAKDQTLRMVIREPTSMDPNLAGDHSIWYVDQVFEGLYKVLDDGKLIMLGARSLEVAKDGLTWTFKLNPAAKWSDGKPVTARDYEFSWKRALDPKLASDTATFFYAIKGAEDYNTGKQKDVAQVGVKALDDLTLQVKMDKPAPYFRSVAGLTYLYPVPQHAVEKFGDKWTEAANVVTNGVFRMESWKHDQEMVLARNDGYWGKKPTLQKVVFRIVPAAELCVADFRAYEANETDFAMCVPTPDIERVQKDPALSKQLTAELLSASQFLVFDAGRAPWSNVKVRQALNLAIDREKVTQVLSRGLYKPTRVLVPPGIQGHKPANALKGGVAEAKKLLAEAGFPDGKGFPEFKLTAPDIRGNRILAELLQQMWKDALGIATTQVEIMEPKAFSAWRSARKGQPFDVYSRGGWWSDYEDPTNWYNTLVEEDWLNTHWKHEPFSKLTRAGASELNQVKRKQMFEEADAILERESPTVGLWYFTDYWMRKPWVKGLQHTRILGFVWLRDTVLLEH